MNFVIFLYLTHPEIHCENPTSRTLMAYSFRHQNLKRKSHGDSFCQQLLKTESALHPEVVLIIKFGENPCMVWNVEHPENCMPGATNTAQAVQGTTVTPAIVTGF